MKLLKLFFLLALGGCASVAAAQGSDGRHGWPEQKAPEKLIVCPLGESPAEAMLVESLSGLAAQAVNEGRFDTMVWIETDNASYRALFEESVAALGIGDVRRMEIDELVALLRRKGVLRGYVLYRADAPRANPYASNPATDYSANVATVYASLLRGALVDESLVDRARKLGLRELKDARHETAAECFERNRHRLSRRSALSIPPSVHNLRDYAIAHRLMLYADQKELIDPVLEWVEPLSPILGWGCGDEYDFTSVIARWGHYNTATNWCLNLPFLSSVGEAAPVARIEPLDPRTIDFDDRSPCHAFVMSDGDNVQWSMDSYGESPVYMGGPGAGRAGLSWTLCPTELSILSPFTWNKMVGRLQAGSSFLEYGGGYQYPDIFAANRPNRPELLRAFARRVNRHMERLGIRIFGFICFDVASPEAQEAFRIYAEEMPGIAGMLAVQYFPYELDGQIYWHPNREGIDIPVVTARYSLWDEVNPHRPRAGVPEFVASLVNRDYLTACEKCERLLGWTIVHAWSDFAESSPLTPRPAIGLNPVLRTRELLLPAVRSVSADELLWRIRMEYRSEQTRRVLNL